jgi:hypothetical protein
MAESSITVREMLAFMETGALFSVQGVTYNRRAKKGGGKIYEYLECMLAQAVPGQKLDRPATLKEDANQRVKHTRNNPNHGMWYTRNIIICQNGHPTTMIRKIHPPLVVYFNGKIVVP